MKYEESMFSGLRGSGGLLGPGRRTCFWRPQRGIAEETSGEPKHAQATARSGSQAASTASARVGAKPGAAQAILHSGVGFGDHPDPLSGFRHSGAGVVEARGV